MPDAFLRRCLGLDLETKIPNVEGHETILRLGAVWRDQTLEGRGDFDVEATLRRLDHLARDADVLLGHNLLGHDLRVLRQLAPHLALHQKPVVDTLYLSPLAFPENPYHHLVKDYKLVRSSVNDPVADARLARRVFRDQWASFGKLPRELLAFYAFALVDEHDRGGLAEVFRRVAGGEPFELEAAVAFLEARFAELTCRRALGELARRELAVRAQRPVWAYVVAWLTVAGGNSVLPPWVRRRYPGTVLLLRALRETPCREGCPWCDEAHDPSAQLKRYFGYDGFRPVPAAPDGGSLQEAIVRAGLAGRPHLAILATGAGKSLCYQLPALVRHHRRGLLTVVISPLQALMKDQVDHVNADTGTDAAAALYGLLTPPERGAVIERVRLGDICLLYIAPEQLRNPSLGRVLEQREIGAWIFDEAHCLSKWGHDFRPDYLYAARFIRQLARRQGVPVPPVAGFTATAKRDVREEIAEHFAHQLAQALEVFRSGVDRAELDFRVEAVGAAEKLPRVAEVVGERLAASPGSAVIYFGTRRRAEEGAEFLRRKGLEAAAFHGGLGSSDKRDVIDAFVEGGVPVVCATNAFGMGIDKEDVRLVVHADIPGSLEAYLQEAGRAGRDRVRADCVLLFDDTDVEQQFKLAARSKLSQRDIAQILRGIRRARRQEGGEVVVTAGELLRDEAVDPGFAAGDPQADTLVKTAVSWLERAGYVERDENRTRVFQGRLRVSSLEEAERRLDRLRLSVRERRRWLALLGALMNAEPDQGLTADDLAELPGVRWDDDPGSESGSGETAAQKVLRILHDMAEARLLTSGLRLTAWLVARGPGNAGAAYAELCRLERAMLDLLAESEPDADDGEWFELALRPLNQRLKDDGFERASPEILRRLLRSLSQDGKGLAGQRGSLELAQRSPERFGVRLLRTWPGLREVSARRQALGQAVLDRLLAMAPPEVTGKVLVELGSEDLTDALCRDLVIRSQLKDTLAAAERALLFLHEQKVIQLQHGLAVFRQAMTLEVREAARGRRYSKGDYAPLAQHYGERTFQIHVMARYAHVGLEKVRAALDLVHDYFELGRKRFVESYFAGEDEVIRRATGRESFRRIVDELANPDQIRLVAAPLGGNHLVLAGPGAGKTRVVVHRAAYLLRVERLPARSLLVLCFNRNAALEVRRRLVELVGDDARGVRVHTYHGLAMRLTGSSFMPWGGGAGTRFQEPDFERLIPEAVALLQDPAPRLGLEAEELREVLLAGFTHLLVDEYQDINAAQYELVSAITGRGESDPEKKLHILAVGDDDQSIYAWSGANVELIRRFRDDYGAEVHYLTENYRSTAHIVAAANQLIAHNRDRMKAARPITVDSARRSAPPGEPVAVVRVADAAVEAQAVAELLAGLEPRQCAVLARRHAVLEPIRAVLEERGVPVRIALDRRALPPLGRVRELASFVARLEGARRELRRASELEAWRAELAGDDAGTWWRLLAEILAEWRDETGDAETTLGAALEHLWEALAERRREASFGDGVRLLTVHAAKGLEFPHVIVPAGFWQVAPEQIEEERRLFYVAMTRARQTLSLMERTDAAQPHTAVLWGDAVARREAAPSPPAAAIVGRRYAVLGLADLYLSFAGTRPANDPIHARLAALRTGDELGFAPTADGHVRLVDSDGGDVAGLSAPAEAQWGPRLDAVERVRVLALVERRAEDSEPAHRTKLRVARWEVPVVEVVLKGGSLPS